MPSPVFRQRGDRSLGHERTGAGKIARGDSNMTQHKRRGHCSRRYAYRFTLALMLGGVVTAATWAADPSPPADASAQEVLARAPGPGSSTADHSKFKALQGPFNSGSEVTRACLSCHTEAAKQVMSNRHWTWEYTNPDTGQTLGKKTMLNSFCIGDRSNEAFCQSCHVGYGWKDDKFDFHDETKVDCL